jgi:hypothetical protein
MLSIDQHITLEEAGAKLLDFVLAAENWVVLDRIRTRPQERPGQNAAYQREVGSLRICASVVVTAGLEVFLRIAFRGPGLSPSRAADHLGTFLEGRIPLTPNSEWQVQVDGPDWVHFVRRYAGAPLEA